MDPYLKYLADQIMGAGKEEAFFSAVFRRCFFDGDYPLGEWMRIYAAREFVRQLDETIPWGRKRFWEVKQKKAADSSVL